VVSYYIDPGITNPYRDEIVKGVGLWNLDAPIKLNNVSAPPSGSYINFIPVDPKAPASVLGRSGVCWKQVGSHDVQISNLMSALDRIQNTVLHELGHAFGLLHEFQHCKSRNYFNISLRDAKSKNIKPGQFSAFECDAILNTGGAMSIGDWDPLSVMNYDIDLYPAGTYEFNKQGLQLLDANGVTPDKLGTRTRLSSGDIEALKRAQGL
jgi:hypothetical protein